MGGTLGVGSEGAGAADKVAGDVEAGTDGGGAAGGAGVVSEVEHDPQDGAGSGCGEEQAVHGSVRAGGRLSVMVVSFVITMS